MLKLNFKKGFTLIELLVVVAIIGLLASIIMVSLNTARGKGRDAARMSDLRQMVNALELFYTDNEYYPVYNGCDFSGGEWLDLQLALSPYIKNLPRDPSKKSNWGYCYYNNGISVKITFNTENNMPNIGNATYGYWSTLYNAYTHERYLQ